MTDEQLFALLLRAAGNARRHNRYGKDAAEFEANWCPNLVRMMETLKRRDLRVDRNYTFLVSVPKWREIFATDFAGRVADHLLCDILAPYVEHELHERTFNNRPGMGLDGAINRVIEDIAEVSLGYTRTAWVIKWDLKGFFPNANCDYMERCFCEIIDRYSDDISARYGDEMAAMLRWLAMITIQCNPTAHCERLTPLHMWRDHIRPDKSLFTKAPGRGVPIGRMTSQIGMGLYINSEVQWLNTVAGLRTTLFMDDGVIVVPDEQKDYALTILSELRQRFREKGVEMNERKFYCQQYWKGLEFLGSHIRPGRIILNDATWHRCLSSIARLNATPERLKPRLAPHLVATVNSYMGLLRRRTSYKRIKTLRRRVNEVWTHLTEWRADGLALRLTQTDLLPKCRTNKN